MRAPADSTNPTTGARARPASLSTCTTLSAWAAPSEPPAKLGSWVKTKTARPSTRPLAGGPPRPPPAPAASGHEGSGEARGGDARGVGEDEDAAAVDAAAGGEHPVAGAGLGAHAARAHLRAHE